MFDDFDLTVNCEEWQRKWDYEVEAFENWYGQSFENYCDDQEKTAKLSKSLEKSQNSLDFYDEY